MWKYNPVRSLMSSSVFMWWVSSGQQPSIHTIVLLVLPPNRMSGKIGREKLRKLVSHDKDRLVSEGKEKTPQTQSFTNPANRPVPKCSLDDGYPGSEKTKSSSSFCYPSLTVEHGTAQSGLFHLCNQTQHHWCQLAVCCAPATQLLDRAMLWTGQNCEECGKKRNPWCCANTAQQQAKCWHVLNTVLVLLNSTR